MGMAELSDLIGVGDTRYSVAVVGSDGHEERHDAAPAQSILRRSRNFLTTRAIARAHECSVRDRSAPECSLFFDTRGGPFNADHELFIWLEEPRERKEQLKRERDRRSCTRREQDTDGR